MTTFIWFLITAISIECLLKVIFLAIGKLPDRTKAATAADIVIGIAIVIWGAILLAKG